MENVFLLGKTGRMMIADFDGKLYRIREFKKCLKVSSEECEERCVHDWHRRLAHRNLMDIRSMKSKGMKIKDCDCSDDCEMCLKGKMSRKPFPKKAKPTENILDVIVSDYCGPMQTESLGKKKGFVTFTDVFSGYTEIKMLKQKSEVVDATIEFIEKLKTQLQQKPKVFRSDRGGEYTAERLQAYLRKEGIIFQCTVGYAPEQNGIAERKNRTLVEAARSMLTESGLPQMFWGEATSTANHVFNRIKGKKEGKSPYEIIFNKMPRVKEFYEFGCDAYVMVPYEKRRKWDDKAKKMKFIGYDDASKGFRMVDENYKIHISREVHFLDTKEFLKRNKDEHEDDEFYFECDDEEEAENDEPDVVPDENEVEVEEAVTEDENEVNYRETPRRSARNNLGLMPDRLNTKSFKAKEEDYEPKTFKEASESTDAGKWLEAMKDELESIRDNETWELSDLPEGKNAVGSKWVFKLKKDETGRIVRYKAMLVAQGFSQKYGIDYDEVFAPVTRSTTMRLLLSVAGTRNYVVKNYDIKTAFLNGKISEEIYMKQPPGFSQGSQVYRLKKSLYGLKQAARVWNQTLHKALFANGFRQNDTDKCLYKLESKGEVCFLLIYVDDLLGASSDENLLNVSMTNIGKDFQLKDLGTVKIFLGIETKRDKNGHFLISQCRYIEKIIEAAKLCDANISKFPLDTGYYKLDGDLLSSNEEYRKLIGMLLYLSTNTRPDIAASVSILSQKIMKPRNCDLNEVKRVIRYLKGTKDLKLRLSSSEAKDVIFAYSDSDWAENRDDRKSNSGQFCSVNGGAISWSCRKQEVVALSSTEAEYVAICETSKEIIWIKRIAKELRVDVPDSVTIYTDSQSSISKINNKKFSNRSKHIDTKYHFIQDQVENGEINLVYHPTETNIADMMTKPLGSIKIKDLRELSKLEEEII